MGARGFGPRVGVRPPFGWFGGKSSLVRHLLQLIPSHVFYGEVFGGVAYLLLAKPPSAVEVYNDIDGNLVNFFRVIRDRQKMERLRFLLDLTPYAEEEAQRSFDLYSRLDSIEDDVERAYWFFYRMRTVHGAILDDSRSFARSVLHSRRGMSSRVSAYLSAIDGLEELYLRFRTVQIDNLDCFEFLDRYECEEGFFYLDPPYHPETRSCGSYPHDMDAEAHERLVGRLLRFRGKVLLSGYDHPVYRRLEDAGWQRKEVHTFTRIDVPSDGKRGEQHRRVEVLWYNYETPSSLWLGCDADAD